MTILSDEIVIDFTQKPVPLPKEELCISHQQQWRGRNSKTAPPCSARRKQAHFFRKKDAADKSESCPQSLCGSEKRHSSAQLSSHISKVKTLFGDPTVSASDYRNYGKYKVLPGKPGTRSINKAE